MFPGEINNLAAGVLEAARPRGLRIATAESCTGGLIGAALTAIPGSSEIFERGAIVYANEAKMEMLGVPRAMLELHGAVSVQVAAAMAEGALLYSRADLAVSCTGIAGPGGGSRVKPVGLVFLAVAQKGKETRHIEYRFGEVTRDEIRLKSVAAALHLLLDAMRDSP